MRSADWATCRDPYDMFKLLGHLRVKALISARNLQRVCLHTIDITSTRFSNPECVRASVARALRDDGTEWLRCADNHAFLGPSFRNEEAHFVRFLGKLNREVNRESVWSSQSHAARAILERGLRMFPMTELRDLSSLICESVRQTLGWGPVVTSFYLLFEKRMRQARRHADSWFINNNVTEQERAQAKQDIRSTIEQKALSEILSWIGLCSSSQACHLALTGLERMTLNTQEASESFAVACDAALDLDPVRFEHPAGFLHALAMNFQSKPSMIVRRD